MSPPDEPKRPLPSADEINAYLELSAARTKKHLPLAFGAKAGPKAPARDRKLRVAAAASPALSVSPAESASSQTESEQTDSEHLKKPSGG